MSPLTRLVFFTCNEGILHISPFTLVKVLEFKDNGEVHRIITQTNSKLPVVTLRRVFGTTPCLPAAFSASHQPSSLKSTTKKLKYTSTIILKKALTLKALWLNPSVVLD